MKNREFKYLCNVPENEQPYLIFDNIIIDRHFVNGHEGWYISIYDNGQLVFKSLTPCANYLECFYLLSAVGIGIPLNVGKCCKR